MKIKIIADSTCDLSQDLVDRYDIEIAPLYIVKGGEAFRDGLEIKPEDIFAYVDSGQGICSTAALNVEDFVVLYGKYSPEYDAVFQFNIGSEFSACYQNATIAAADFENVYVVDSRSLSTGMGHLVLQAAVMAECGIDAETIYKRMLEMTEKLEVSFILDTLEYLHKGGRCSSVAALGANLLKLKPCIEVIDGKMTVGKKYRGSLEKSIEQYITDRLKDRTDLNFDRIFITHSGCSPAIVEAVGKTIREYGRFEEILETSAGCTISNHCGPNCLGILLLRA